MESETSINVLRKLELWHQFPGYLLIDRKIAGCETAYSLHLRKSIDRSYAYSPKEQAELVFVFSVILCWQKRFFFFLAVSKVVSFSLKIMRVTTSDVLRLLASGYGY